VNHQLDSRLLWHLPISFGVSGFISLTHSFFLVELASQRGLFPVLFRGTRADLTPGAVALSLRARGVLWAISAGICPIGSLLLLSFAPVTPGSNPQWLAVFVGSVGIAFGLFTAILISRLVMEPIDYLRTGAQAIARGDLSTHIPLVRVDEFGLLIGEFNRMIAELREKDRLQRTFGLHVGRKAAEQILARDPGLGGVEEVITVMFVDIRSFTTMSAAVGPRETVKVLNRFLGTMVQVVEARHGGMVNKFLGDGFLALFGVGGSLASHADAALEAGRDMLRSLAQLNQDLALEGKGALAIGVGIHTGPAIVGSFGSPERLEYTAIGSTVNFASRIEHLTKVLGTPLLLSQSTRRRLRSGLLFKEFPPQQVRGLDEPVKLFSLAESG
jgi:adenylate cyclase